MPRSIPLTQFKLSYTKRRKKDGCVIQQIVEAAY